MTSAALCMNLFRHYILSCPWSVIKACIRKQNTSAANYVPSFIIPNQPICRKMGACSKLRVQARGKEDALLRLLMAMTESPLTHDNDGKVFWPRDEHGYRWTWDIHSYRTSRNPPNATAFWFGDLLRTLYSSRINEEELKALMLLRPSMGVEEMRGQSWKRDCTSAKGQPERNITPFPDKEKLPYSSLLGCIEPHFTDVPKLIPWVAYWPWSKHSQERSARQFFEWKEWNASSIWMPSFLDSTLKCEVKYSSGMCALTLCLWALVRWQRDPWPASGVQSLNLRSVTETFQQPSKCMHCGLFISQDVFHF